MQRTYEYHKNGLTDEQIEWYAKMNKGFTIDGDTITENIGEASQTLVVLRGGNHTPYGGVRDLGNHWIFARYGRYDRVDKADFKLTRDVEDV